MTAYSLLVDCPVDRHSERLKRRLSAKPLEGAFPWTCLSIGSLLAPELCPLLSGAGDSAPQVLQRLVHRPLGAREIEATIEANWECRQPRLLRSHSNAPDAVAAKLRNESGGLLREAVPVGGILKPLNSHIAPPCTCR